MTQATALITGASSGFGQAIAKRYAKLGYKLILIARRIDKLESLAQNLETNCHLIQLDVRDQQAVFNHIENLPEPFKKIDILVNNAGLALGLGPAHKADLEDWETMIDTNIKGLTYMTRAVSPLMVAAGNGHIVNMGSVAGDWPYPGGNTYGATKAFVKQFSLNLRADLSGTGIRVTNIEPGMAETEFSLVRFKGDSDKADSIYQGLEALSADDVAETVVWATGLPQHVNINRIEVMPTCQSFGAFAFNKN